MPLFFSKKEIARLTSRFLPNKISVNFEKNTPEVSESTFVCTAFNQSFPFHSNITAQSACIFVELKMKKNTSIAFLSAATLVAQRHGVFSVPATGAVLGNTLPYPHRVRR
jgi:hypothetical protein